MEWYTCVNVGDWEMSYLNIYAMLLAVKNLTGRPVTFVCFTNVSTIFQGMSIPIVYPTNLILNKLRHLPKTRERAAGYFQLSFIANIPSYDVVICCYFQAFKYFYFMRDTVKKEFTFRKHIRSRADAILHRVRKQLLGASTANSTRFIGIHVRRGDFLGAAKANHNTWSH